MDVTKKLHQLNIVFEHALKASLRADGDYFENFQDDPDVKSLINELIVETESETTIMFGELCKAHDISQFLLHSERNSEILNTHKNSISKVVHKLHSIEFEKLSEEIIKIEHDMKNMKDQANRLRAQIKDEVASLDEENRKVSIAASQL